jgi:hypothetical protein
VDDNGFGVPAGWYPDPLGLPQLRWWDSQAWTEHTSEARAPIVIQPATRLGFADEELPARDEAFPSRREQRERERRERSGSLLDSQFQTDTDVEQDELSAQPLLAMTLRELEPPLTDTVDDITPVPKRATTHANSVPAASALSDLTEELPPERELKQTRTYTGAVWLIAIMPLLQVGAAIALIAGLKIGNNLPLVLTIVVLPYLLVLGIAAYDRLLLQVWGHISPASQFWSFLTAPVYLIARAVRTYRATGKGFAPLVVFASAIMGVVVGIIILPGLVISVFPATFSAEVERSVQADAAALGADITVECPAPPLIVGESFTCVASKPNGAIDAITVSLQRQNGWIGWQVEDWGSAVLAD